MQQEQTVKTPPRVIDHLRSHLGLTLLWYALSLVGSLLVVQAVIGLSGQLLLIERYGASMALAAAVALGFFGGLVLVNWCGAGGRCAGIARIAGAKSRAIVH